MVLSALSNSLDFFAVVQSGNCLPCSSSGGSVDFFSVVQCSDSRAVKSSSLPIHLIFFSYMALILIPIYFRTIHRATVFACWVIVTIFLIAGAAVGSLLVQGFVVIMAVLVLLSIYEAERARMLGYVLLRNQIVSEQQKLAMEAKNAEKRSNSIETKMQRALVHQILPPKVAEAIKQGKTVYPESFDEVTIFFSDVEGFTNICAQVKPIDVVNMLNDLYTVMDYCTSLFPLYKVETIGDAYMVCVCPFPLSIM